MKPVKKVLGISGVNTSSSAWSKRADDEEGTQIDLLTKRNFSEDSNPKYLNNNLWIKEKRIQQRFL